MAKTKPEDRYYVISREALDEIATTEGDDRETAEEIINERRQDPGEAEFVVIKGHLVGGFAIVED